MWEHFRFNRDMEFLRERLYPVFKESAEFGSGEAALN
ncbi:glycosyl hydrolase family 95 catalytic domain-containing protein [Tunturibacter empetritectus]